MFTGIVTFTRRPRRVVERVKQVAVVRTSPFRSQGVKSTFRRFQRHVTFVRVRAMVDRVLNSRLGFFRALFRRRTGLFLSLFRQCKLMAPHASQGNAVQANAIAPFNSLRMNMVPKDHRGAINDRFPIMKFARVIRRFFPVRLSVRAISFQRLVLRIFRRPFKGASRSGRFASLPFLLNLSRVRCRVGQLFLNVSSGATNVRGGSFAVGLVKIVFSNVPIHRRLTRGLLQVRRIL